jgi:hypothetical protein
VKTHGPRSQVVLVLVIMLTASGVAATAQTPSAVVSSSAVGMAPAALTGWNRFDDGELRGTETGKRRFDGRQLEGSVASGGGGAWHYRGERWDSITVETTDPRISGSMSAAWDEDSYVLRDGRVAAVQWGFWRIDNDEGFWAGSMTGPAVSDGDSWATAWLTGGGAYQGLSAVLRIRSTGEIDGVIIPGGPPGTR